jgi:plastocyanin
LRIRTLAAASGHGDRHSKRDDDHRGARRAIAGTGTSRFSLNAFYPASTRIRVGRSITWLLGVNEVHTLTFGPEAVIAPIVQTLLGRPGGPTLNPLGALPTEPPSGPVVHSTNVHGDGLLGSGIVRDNPGGPPNTFTVKFTQAGTFTFDCLIHNGMSGTVTVTNRGSHGAGRHARGRPRGVSLPAVVRCRSDRARRGPTSVRARTGGRARRRWRARR